MLEELRRPASVGAKQQASLSVDHASIEVRNRHRRSADRSLAVHLCVVLLDDFFVGAAQPFARDRESAVAANLGDTGLLQQRQSHAAGANEDEVSHGGGDVTGVHVLGGDLPLGTLRRDVGDLGAIADLGAGLHCACQELLGQRTVVDVGADLCPGNSDAFGEVTSRTHQRKELAELVRILGVFHTWEQGVLAQCLIALLQVLDLVRAVAEGHVGNLVDEVPGVRQNALFQLVC